VRRVELKEEFFYLVGMYVKALVVLCNYRPDKWDIDTYFDTQSDKLRDLLTRIYPDEETYK